MLHTKFRGNRPAGSGEEDFLRFLLGMSNHARLDIRRFGSGIRIHPKVRIISHRIYETKFAWYMKDHIVASETKL